MHSSARSFAAYISLLLLASGCASGPIDYPREYSEAVTDTEDTLLGREVAEFQADHPGKSGFYPLARGIDALGARLTLMDQAEHTIDAQYFLMKSDEAGLIFAGNLLEAADRGVRVRFLLDDIFTNVDDRGLLLLDAHPNIEVRLFNPISRRGFYYLNYLGSFKRANRRMHNKSFIVDNQMGVVGGRNIAAEYFELEQGKEFVDFDMLAVGTVAAEVSKTFDRFWNHEFSVPVQAFAERHSEEQLEKTRRQVLEALEMAGETNYARAIDSRYRKPMIKAGVELYEARANAGSEASENEVEALTLHTKGVLIDRRLTFVGSLNIDPRSVDINTEMGVLIESAELAAALSSAVQDRLKEIAYRVELDDDDDLVWRTVIGGKEVEETTEPLSSGWRRFKATMSKVLPESQL